MNECCLPKEALIAIAMYNWNTDGAWCYNYAGEWFVQLKNREWSLLGETMNECWLPFFQLAVWAVMLGSVLLLMVNVLWLPAGGAPQSKQMDVPGLPMKLPARVSPREF